MEICFVSITHLIQNLNQTFIFNIITFKFYLNSYEFIELFVSSIRMYWMKTFFIASVNIFIRNMMDSVYSKHGFGLINFIHSVYPYSFIIYSYNLSISMGLICFTFDPYFSLSENSYVNGISSKMSFIQNKIFFFIKENK